MKKLLLETSFSKIYMIVMIIITLLILGGYFSYAMFTVSKERGNAISIVTGNLEYKLTVDGEETNKLTVESNSVKDFIVTLSNPNNIKARFNFYYIGEEPSYTKIGYIVKEGMNIPPLEVGTTLEKVNTTGSSNTYIVRLINNSSSSVEFTLGVSVGLDYNDLKLPDDGHLLEEITDKGEVGTVVLDDISKDSIYDDGTDTFITGEHPNNYIWYSGKLWRAVSVNNEEKTVKLVTQWNISSIPYNEENNTNFAGSYMEEWLNDKTVDGFLYNLRDYEKFIKLDSKWNATAMSDTSKPPSTTIVEDPVGLLNIYEYAKSFTGTTPENGYLNNNIVWFTITPYDSTHIWSIVHDGTVERRLVPDYSSGIRPTINLKIDIKIVSGRGTEDNPYRLLGDNDEELSGTRLNARYSGEYIRFGSGENNLYRIVSHETKGLTKITSSLPLKENGSFKTTFFGDTTDYSSSNIIGTFLNNDYLNTNNGYLTSDNLQMIENNTLWYLGEVQNGLNYRLAKYVDENMTDTTINTSAKVGLLRLGELMSGQFDNYENNSSYWLLTPYFRKQGVWKMQAFGAYTFGEDSSKIFYSIKPTFNLKQNVVITSGDGTKENPFTLELST